MTDQAARPQTLEELLDRQKALTRRWLRAGDVLPSDQITDQLERIRRDPSTDDVLAEHMLRVLVDWSWVHRRVEDIQVVDDGQTRRRISFDFEPQVFSRWAGADSQDHGEDQGHVPLTFLRKGMIINLDLQAEDGSTMPAVTRTQNTRLVFHPIRRLATDVGLDALAAELFTDTGYSADHLARLIDLGVLYVCQSRDFYKGGKSPTSVERRQEAYRHNLFVALGRIVRGSVDDDPKSLARTAPEVRVPLPLIRVDEQLIRAHGQRPGASTADAADAPDAWLDSSGPVQLLACLLAERISTVLAEDRTDENSAQLAKLEMLAILLAVSSVGYLFGVVLDLDGAESGDRAGIVRTRRRVVKLACDVESLPADRDRLRILSWLWNPRVTLHFRHSQWSARGNHLSFTPPKNAVIRKVTRFVDDPQWSTGELEVSNRAIATIQAEDAEQAPQKNQVKCVDPGDTTDDYGGAFDVANGSYRVSQTRLHIANIRHSREAVRSLQFEMVPVRTFLPATAAMLTVVLAALVVAAGFDSGFQSFLTEAFGLGPLIETETLIVAVFGAIFLTTGRHHLEMQLSRWARTVVVVSMALAVAAPVWLIIMLRNQDSVEVGRGLHVVAWILLMLAVSVAVCAVIGTALSQSPTSTMKRDSVIDTEDRETAPPRSILAVTEIDAFDVGYLSRDARDRLKSHILRAYPDRCDPRRGPS